MFHPAGFGVDLFVLLLIHGNDIPTMVENNEARAGRPLVNGTDIFGHEQMIPLINCKTKVKKVSLLTKNSRSCAGRFYILFVGRHIVLVEGLCRPTRTMCRGTAVLNSQPHPQTAA